jgi:hypothetical protein
MGKKLKIIHEKRADFFGKQKHLAYEAYEFENGKLAYVGEDGNVYADKDRATVVEALTKQGPVSVEEAKKPHDKGRA